MGMWRVELAWVWFVLQLDLFVLVVLGFSLYGFAWLLAFVDWVIRKLRHE